MNKPNNYDNTQAAGQWSPLAPGGYVCRIVSAQEGSTRQGKPQLEIALDIAEGPEAGRFQKEYLSDSRGEKKWPASGLLRQLTEDNDGNCNPFFKALMTAIEESNPGWQPAWGGQFCEGLKGRLVGVIFRREQYQKQNGDLAWSTRALWARPADAIRQGVEAPEDKPLPDAPAAQSEGPGASCGAGGAGPEGPLPF